MRWRIGSYFVGLLLVAGLTQCAGGRRGETITLKGSDTMVILGQRWAEAYMESHKGVIIQVTGGGSGTGIAALINGTTDVAQSSRSIKDEEQKQIAGRDDEKAHEMVMARDGLAIYVHESNPITEISIPQLKAIYTGEATNWSQLGGPNAPIVVYGRENNSGTYVYFKEHVLENGDFAAGVQTLPGTAAVVNAVAQDKNAIGYGGAAYGKGVRELAVKKDDSTPGVKPSLATVADGSYPISRPLFWYTRRPPTGALSEFVTWAQSDEGQKIVTEVGYFPIGSSVPDTTR